MEFWDDGDRSSEDVKKHYFYRSDVKSWIGRLNGTPFAYLQIYFITEHHQFNPWKSKKNTTLGLDFFIGESLFLGKGLAADLLKHFIHDVIKAYLPCRLLVDPEGQNLKALHIYNKMGFQQIGELRNKSKVYKILKKDVS